MRKTLAVVALTTALTGGTATLALADDAVAEPQVVAQATDENADSDDSDKSGLWGLLGLLGLAGLAKRKENHGVDAHPRR